MQQVAFTFSLIQLLSFFIPLSKWSVSDWLKCASCDDLDDLFLSTTAAPCSFLRRSLALARLLDSSRCSVPRAEAEEGNGDGQTAVGEDPQAEQDEVLRGGRRRAGTAVMCHLVFKAAPWSGWADGWHMQTAVIDSM